MSADAQTEEIHTTKWLNFKNTLHIGVLNYKSRPKFTLMMTFALFVCAITMFLVISLFGQSLIQPTMTTLDNTGVEGKVILSNRENDITQEQLDEVAGSTKAGFSCWTGNFPSSQSAFPERAECCNHTTLPACILRMNIISNRERRCLCYQVPYRVMRMRSDRHF